MIRFQLRRMVMATAVAGLVLGAYAAGRAESADDNVTKMNLSIDMLVKARALLDATSVRRGAVDVSQAKASIDKAIESTNKAVKANGG
jgi:hypothetical protein